MSRRTKNIETWSNLVMVLGSCLPSSPDVFEKRTLGVGFSSASDGISCITCIIYPRSLKNRWHRGHLGHLAMIFLPLKNNQLHLSETSS